MDINGINEMLANNFDDINEIIKQSFNQLFGRDIKLSQKISDETNTIIAISEAEYPRLHISFRSKGKNTLNHLVTMNPTLGLKLFAWMIGDEPDTEFGDEHVEGLQEAASQIFGQIQTAFEADGNPLKIDEIKIKSFDSVEEAIGTIDEEEGSASIYTAEIDEEYDIRHYVWFVESNEVAEDVEKSVEEDILGNLEEEEEKVNVNPTSFQDFDNEKTSGDDSRNIDMLLDVDLEAVVELGRKSIPIKDVLQLGRGSIIELNKTAGEPLDIFVNNKKLAEGEVVVVDERFGIRITHLIDPKQRLQNLK
ncbi:MAG: flagellar motor switch protein FliN [Fidelibacterota bacterium]